MLGDIAELMCDVDGVSAGTFVIEQGGEACECCACNIDQLLHKYASTLFQLLE
jgi:hypothetical protein